MAFRNVLLKPSEPTPGENVAVSVWSCHVSQPKRSVMTVESFRMFVLLIARMCGRRRNTGPRTSNRS